MASSTIRAGSDGRRSHDEAWTENRASRRRIPRLDFRELWDRRELVLFLALRDFKLRYTQAFLGVAWVLIRPLAGAAIFYGVFGQALDVPSDGIPYLVFVFAGVAVWTYVSGAVEAAAESLAGDAALVTKVYFPRLAAPLAAVLPGLFDLGVSLIVLGVLMVLYEVAPSAAIVTLPLWIAAAVGVALVIGIWLSALNAQYRDVRYGLSFTLQIWFFASPIVYSSSVISGGWKYVFAANPLVGVLDGVRWSALSGPAPGWQDVVSLCTGLILLVTGLLYFRAVERRLADVI